MRLRPRTLRGRLALFYAVVLALVLVAYSGAVYYVAIFAEEASEGQDGDSEEVLTGGRRVLWTLALALPISLGIAVGGGMWAARRIFVPLAELVAVAGELGDGRLDRRIPPKEGAGEEVERLIAALNGMLARMEGSVKGMRRFTADASHELRTPLAVLMGNLELSLRRSRSADELRATVEGTLEEMGNLSLLLESLLTLARSDSRELHLSLSRVDAAEVTRRTVEPYEAIAAERGISLALEVRCPETMVVADPLWLGRAVANLVDNACKFTPPGGQVEVTVTDNPGVQITVCDSGPGLLDEERERAFERFYRGTKARGEQSGFGLGLPLARDVVRALGGELRLLPTGLCGAHTGACFAIELPRARPEGPAGSVHQAAGGV